MIHQRMRINCTMESMAKMLREKSHSKTHAPNTYRDQPVVYGWILPRIIYELARQTVRMNNIFTYVCFKFLLLQFWSFLANLLIDLTILLRWSRDDVDTLCYLPVEMLSRSTHSQLMQSLLVYWRCEVFARLLLRLLSFVDYNSWWLANGLSAITMCPIIEGRTKLAFISFTSECAHIFSSSESVRKRSENVMLHASSQTIGFSW